MTHEQMTETTPKTTAVAREKSQAQPLTDVPMTPALAQALAQHSRRQIAVNNQLIRLAKYTTYRILRLSAIAGEEFVDVCSLLTMVQQSNKPLSAEKNEELAQLLKGLEDLFDDIELETVLPILSGF